MVIIFSGMFNSLLNDLDLSTEIAFMLVLLFTVVFLFIWEPIPITFIAMLVPIILVIARRWTDITVKEALSGFSNPATITVMSMFVFSMAIQKSGAVQLLGDKISQITGSNEKKQVAMISILSGTTSSVIYNTPIVAALIPMVRDLARRTKVSPSKLLIPLSYATMLGGTMTLIGTSTNLLASQTVDRLLGEPFHIFEFTALGVMVLIVGIIYLITIGHRLVPERIKIDTELTNEYDMRDYLSKVLIEKNSKFVGKVVKDIYDEKELDYDILRLIRGDEEFMEPLDSKTIMANDYLIIRATSETLVELVSKKGIKTLPELIVDDASVEQKLEGETMVEIVVPNHSFLVDKTLEELNFLDRYDCTVLAIRRGEDVTREAMEDYRFKPGDLILLLVTQDTFERMRENNDFIIDKTYNKNYYDSKKMYISLAVLIFFILSVSFNLIPVAIAAFASALSMVLLKVIGKNEFFDAIDWEVFFLLAGLIPFGIALEKTGTAKYIANKILNLSSVLSTLYMLMIIYFITSLITNVISNNASVLLMIPIAIEAANQLNSNPIAFAIAVTFAASAAFASPMGYQTNLMVYSSGGYNFKDFIVAGAPLQLIMTLVVPLLIKMIWGL
jgi:di/tricarboxylate transporter